MKNYFIIILCLFMLLLIGCSSPEEKEIIQLVNEGNYDEASSKTKEYFDGDYKKTKKMLNIILEGIQNEKKVLKKQMGYISLTDKQKSDIWLYAKQHVKDILKAPSSVKFPVFDEKYVKAAEDKIEVRAWVEAQNSFGATLKQDFVVVLDDITFDLISVRIIE